MQKNENCDSIYIAFKNKLNKQTKKMQCLRTYEWVVKLKRETKGMRKKSKIQESGYLLAGR